jgi:RNA polymerase sigma-70 factor (ECF subfamily)
MDEAQELTQETAARAWERRNTISHNVRAWLFQTLYHTFISSRRRQGRWRESSVEFEEEGAKSEGPPDQLPAIIVNEDVRRAIETLPDDLRAVVWLSDAEELPLREIAHVLDCPLGTVASRLWRARRELRKLLSAYGPREEKQR